VRLLNTKSRKGNRMTNPSIFMIRTKAAGVFFGEISWRNKGEIQLRDARRVWYWDGAASLSELAMRGTSKPRKCKFPVAVPLITLRGVIEMIPMTEQAVASLRAVPEWTGHE